MKQLWKTYRVPAGFTLVCLLLAANALRLERIRPLPFAGTVYRQHDDPMMFWASVAILFGMALVFPVLLMRSAMKRGRAVPFADQVND